MATEGGRRAVVFVGRHEPRKGLDVLLDAFAGLPDSAVLWVVGDGPATEMARRRHPESERVRWLGRLSDREVSERLAGASVMCAPSLGGESFGVVLLEGMAAGCSMVASDIEGYREAAGGHASLVEPGDPGALDRRAPGGPRRRRRREGRSSPEALRAAAEHARSWSMDTLAALYVDVYERAASGALQVIGWQTHGRREGHDGRPRIAGGIRGLGIRGLGGIRAGADRPTADGARTATETAIGRHRAGRPALRPEARRRVTPTGGGKGRGTNGSNRSGAKVVRASAPHRRLAGRSDRGRRRRCPLPPRRPSRRSPASGPPRSTRPRWRRTAVASVALCGYTAIAPALIVGALCWVAVSVVVAVVGLRGRAGWPS